MTIDNLILNVNIVNVSPCVPTIDLVALQCNLFTFHPMGTLLVYKITVCTKYVWMGVAVYVKIHQHVMLLLFTRVGFVQFSFRIGVLLYFRIIRLKMGGCNVQISN